MAGRGSQGAQQARTQAERARLYAARRAWHEGQIRRRVRDNTIAGIVGGLIVVGAIASQVVHAQVTAPAPTPTPTVTPAPTPTDAPTPDESPEPQPTETTAP
jgi:hypothetical protein